MSQMLIASLLNSSVKKRSYKIAHEIKIVRNIGSGSFGFREIFQGFDGLESVKKTFGKNTMTELDNLKIEVFPKEGFMGVSDEDGHVFASQYYLNNGEESSVYLDIIHELVHVKQFKQGKNLFDPNYAYVDRPTEIEAYQVAALEARRIGMNDQEIFDYLEVPWISRDEHERLAKSCDVDLRLVGKSSAE
ncbi:MAG: hypothetical protein OK439_07500 [Thaumarchaeota archaeon]|nr:hypothetical protein [Nitrososphaerota archaeon]